MSLLQAYSLDLGKIVNEKEADISYEKGLISSQKTFNALVNHAVLRLLVQIWSDLNTKGK